MAHRLEDDVVEAMMIRMARRMGMKGVVGEGGLHRLGDMGVGTMIGAGAVTGDYSLFYFFLFSSLHSFPGWFFFVCDDKLSRYLWMGTYVCRNRESINRSIEAVKVG